VTLNKLAQKCGKVIQVKLHTVCVFVKNMLGAKCVEKRLFIARREAIEITCLTERWFMAR